MMQAKKCLCECQEDQRYCSYIQYLSKFLPHLSDITKPLREGHHLGLGSCPTTRFTETQESCH